MLKIHLCLPLMFLKIRCILLLSHNYVLTLQTQTIEKALKCNLSKCKRGRIVDMNIIPTEFKKINQICCRNLHTWYFTTQWASKPAKITNESRNQNPIVYELLSDAPNDFNIYFMIPLKFWQLFNNKKNLLQIQNIAAKERVSTEMISCNNETRPINLGNR